MLLKLIIVFTLFSFNAFAQTGASTNTAGAPSAEKKSELRANFKRIALDLSSTDVYNADEYQGSSVAPLKAKSETVVKGVFDFVLEYERTNFQWNNSLFMTYGKTKTKDFAGAKDSDESSDEILLTTDYAHKLWKFKEADIGPFANVGYQTEFTQEDGSPRNKIVRGKAGVKLFNGIYISDLYAAGVAEVDMTYAKDTEKYAWEVGMTADYTLRDGVKFHFDGYYRDYVSYSRFNPEDLEYDLNLTTRMDVKMYNKFSLSPFMSYRQAHSRQAETRGSNFKIGISISYSDLFKLF